MSFYRSVKRGLDLLVSSVGLVVVAPVLLPAAAAVRLFIGSPIVFRQERAGLGGKPFGLIKLRTMRDETGPDGRPLPDDERVTAVGSFLRRTSIDELPQLWNVLRGEMSLVGPRPLLVEYLPLYNAEQTRRHLVKPGITGLAQVNGRNSLNWEERFEFDVRYVDRASFAEDLRILGATFVSVVSGEGIGHAGGVGMPRFTGTPEPTETLTP
ncbi:MAG TPA: sugar transferase [Coriobacteriia bacterium]